MGYSNQLITVYHSLATMLDAGLPILRSMDRVAEYAKGSLKRTLIQVENALSREGKTVHEAMSEHPKVFAEFDRTLIRAADESGNLHVCFKMLSEWYEFLRRMKRIVKAGVVLPLLLLHFAFLIFYMTNAFIDGSGYAMAMINVFRALAVTIYGPWLIIWLILAYGKHIPLLRMILDRIVLWIPLMGKGMRELCISRFAKSFNMLYKAGVPISECFASAPQAAGNLWVSRMFSGGSAMIAQGKVPSEGFSRRLPREYIDLWTIGEETGDLDKCVDKIAEISSDRAALYLGEVARWLPRLLYLGYMILMLHMIAGLAGRYVGQLNAF
ncbi:MAG: type II secretion system F family protein [Phycisphaeraceae bacterium]|nr:type II secretion system F family protein [Phycisphaeraceae bacterium]